MQINSLHWPLLQRRFQLRVGWAYVVRRRGECVCQICPTFEGCQRIGPSQIKKRPCPCHLDKMCWQRKSCSGSTECPALVKIVLILLIFNAGGRQEGKLTYVCWMIDGAEKSALRRWGSSSETGKCKIIRAASSINVKSDSKEFLFLIYIKLKELLNEWDK